LTYDPGGTYNVEITIKNSFSLVDVIGLHPEDLDADDMSDMDDTPGLIIYK